MLRTANRSSDWQVTQLNAGKKTAGIDGKKSLTFEERFQLEKVLKKQVKDWKHQGLREIPIPKKDGTTRQLKVPTIADRAWQCLLKYALEPAHEATFHARSFRAFPKVRYSENRFINVKGKKSPFDGDINYWAKRNNFLYDGTLAKILRKQNHSCGCCKNKIIDDERVEIHHIDGNHNNWDEKNLLGIHRSCHQYIHMGKSSN